MKVKDLELSQQAIDFLTEQGYTELYPPQEQSVNAGLLENKSILVATPTASGKTLIAIIAMLHHLLKDERRKIVYLTPLRALASEKYLEFKKLESIHVGKKISVQISTGDFDSIQKNLDICDVLVLTNERMDSLMRHGSEWIENIDLVVSDEIHLIGDQGRGPTLETILTKLKRLDKKPQILALSATVTNVDEISQWLDCNLVENDWRPVPLSEGVYDMGTVAMQDGRNFEISSSLRGPPVDLGADSVKSGGQSLLFAETRTRSVSLATKAADVISKLLEKNDMKNLEKISQDILNRNEHTELIKSLATLIKKGVAFHHAGLNQDCRQTVESEFRKGTIKLLTATPTLAAGVNLPARRVVISSVKRYNARIGVNSPISVLEYKQLCGRAGRPQYDKFGESIIVGSSNRSELIDYYINGEPEPIESKITEDKALRTHLLSLIVTSPGIQKNEILDFFLQTLGGLQSSKPTIKFAIDIATRFLLTEKLIIRKGERFVATEFGKIVSMLYLDPLTATSFRSSLQTASKGRNSTFGFLHLITESEEFFPKFALRNKDYEIANNLMDNHLSELIRPISEYDCSRSLLALQMWIDESSEVSLSDKLGIESGDMHRIAESAKWLIHCLRELAKHLERPDLLEELDILQKRTAYGIKEELIDLVKIRGIGRIRARKLYKNNIKNRSELSKIPVKKLAEIDKIGSTLADNIKSQLRKDR